MKQSAVCVIYDHKGRVLILKRPENDRSFPNVWCLPGGKLDDGETLLDCVHREVFEETEIILISASFLKTCNTGDYEMSFYGGHGVANNVEISSEHTAYMWLNLEDIAKYDIAPVTCEVLKEIAERDE